MFKSWVYLPQHCQSNRKTQPFGFEWQGGHWIDVLNLYSLSQ